MTRKPKISDLKAAHKKLLAASRVSRIIALLEAVGWWDSYIPYMIQRHGSFGDQQTKIMRRADLMRKLALGNTSDGEKETALYQTIRQYEKLWPGVITPSIEEAYSMYENQRGRLEKSEANMVRRYSDLLSTLDAAFRNSGVVFTVIKSDKPQRFDGAGKIVLSTDKADSLVATMRSEGCLAAVFAEAPAVARVAGIERDAQGNRSFSVQQCMHHLPGVFDGIKAYCAEYLEKNSAAKLFRAGAKAPESPSTPSPRPTRKSSGGPKIAGCYKPGSALAKYFRILVDGCHHSYSDLQAAHYVSFPKDTVWYIKDRGKKNGRWTVRQDKTGATMTIHDEAVRLELG